MAKITEYPEAQSFDAGDVILKDGTNGTKKMTAETLKSLIAPVDSTLSQTGKAADAKAVGDAAKALESTVNGIGDVALSGEEVNLSQYASTGAFISTSSGKWITGSGDECWIAPIYENVKFVSVTANSSQPAMVAMLTTNSHTAGTDPDYVTGESMVVIEAGATKHVKIPFGCQYCYIAKANDGTNYAPASFKYETPAVPPVDNTLRITGRPADAKTIGEGLFYKEIPLYPNYFYAKRYIKSDGSMDTAKYCAASITFTFTAPFRIVSDSDAFLVRLYDGSLSVYASEHTKTGAFTGKIILKKNDTSATLTSEDLAHFHLYSTEGGYKEWMEQMQVKIDHTRRFAAMANDQTVKKVKVIYADADTLGMLSNDSGYTGHRGTTMPYYSDSDMDIWVGRSGTITANIIIDGELATISSGQYFHIPAGKRFAIDMITSPADYSGDFQTAVIMVVNKTDADPNGLTQTAYTAGSNTAIQCAARVGDKTIIATSGSKYSVFASGNGTTTTLVDAATLDHDVGHANQGNYDNGYFYISDWTDSSLIHVFAFDDTTNELTYSKDIEIPVESDFERNGYYVTDTEKQIYFFGWVTGRNAAVYGLYIKAGDTYKLAWKRYANAPKVINGFTVQGNYLYYPDNYLENGTYTYNNIFRINMLTGATEYNKYTPSGNIMIQESEAIIAIGNQTFLLPTHLGSTFIMTFVKA